MSNEHEVFVPGAVPLTVNLDGTGMFASPYPSAEFDAVLTGPPGGPLSFLVWKPLPDERDPTGLERSTRRAFRLQQPLAMASTARVRLAGADRDALCFVENQGFAQVGWCIARIDHAGASAMVGFGCAVGNNSVTCETVLGHPSLRRVADSLKVVA